MTSRQQIWLLSGGIGSGKSTAREMLAASGINTIDSDSIGHQVLAPGGTAVEEVISRWPHASKNGVVDRSRLAEVVFPDPDELQALEQITHPHIFSSLREQLDSLDRPVVVELSLLIQPFSEELPRMVVDASDQARLSRVVDRGLAEDDVRNRMARQPSRAKWLAAADLVIPNHGGTADLKMMVAGLVKSVLSPSAEQN